MRYQTERDQINVSDRDQVIAAIRDALNRRSGQSWSVTGGRGTAYGWIRIDAPPARRTGHFVSRNGGTNPSDFDHVDTGVKGGVLTPADAAKLAELLGKDTVHCQGESIPASSEYRREYLQRARGEVVTVNATPYWD